MTFFGADVSEYQRDIDWQAFNPGASFVFIKASEGVGYKDSKFDQNKAGVRSLGADMPHGFYHFLRGYDPVQEAHWFIQCVGDIQPGEVLALDYEIGLSSPGHACRLFIDTVEQLVGFKPIFYTNQDRLVTLDFSETAASGDGLWVAHYGLTADQDVPIRWWAFYSWHQTSSSGNFPGISGRVDTDAFFANQITDFYKYGKPQPTAIPVPVAQPAPEVIGPVYTPAPPAPVVVGTPSDPAPPVIAPTLNPAPIPAPSTPPVTVHPPVYSSWYVLWSRILDFIFRRYVKGKAK